MDSIEFSLLLKEDYKEAIQLISDSFARAEPLTHYQGITKEEFLYFAKAIVEGSCHSIGGKEKESKKLVTCSIGGDFNIPVFVEDQRKD